MKVVPQIIIFLIIIAIGWFTYERHEAFRALVDDILDYSGLTQQITREVADTNQPSNALSADTSGSKQSTEAMVVATDTAEKEIKVKSDQQTDSREIVQKQPAPVEEALVWPDEVQALEAEKPSTEPEKLATSKSDDKKSEAQALESKVKPVPQPDEVQLVEEEIRPSSELSLPQKPESAGPVEVISPTKNKEAAQATIENTKPRNEVNTGEIMPSMATRKQLALAGLAAARAAWQQGDHDRSVNLYNQLIREYKNHPDFAGELGNIYFSRGQTELAVNAYSEAFLRLLRNNDFERAQHVLGIVYNIDRGQAASLREYLSE
jgi:tetratricopeptide (TPR) repeat protein